MPDLEKTTLVTGAAGFIGFHVSEKLLERGGRVVGLDNLNQYYDGSLKKARLKILESYKNFIFYKASIQDRDPIEEIFSKPSISRICNLAAQAGVRYSLEDPFPYEKSNLGGFLNILEIARSHMATSISWPSRANAGTSAPPAIRNEW